MKRLMSFQMVAIFWILMLATQGVGGTWTDKEFFYKPGVGARGETEKNTFDTGLDRVDARLGKEIWLGDPSYGTSLQSAIAAIGSNNVTLRMPAGNHAISADQMVPANITLRPERGALLIVATGKTLILNGGIEAGLYQIFSCVGTGKVVFGSPAQLVHSAWFDTLQNAANAVPSGGALRLNAGTYALSAATLTLSTANISVIGDGDSSLITTSSGANKGVYVTAAGVTLKNFAFRPSGTYSGNCIYFENAPGGTAENLAVDGSTATTNFGNSIHITGSANCQVKNNRLIGINGATQRSWNSIQIDDASPNCRVQGNTIIGSRQRGVNVRSGTGLSTGTQIINNYVSNTAEIGIITWNGQTLIKGNVLDGCGLNGIDVTGDPSDSGGTTNNGSIVTGNLVKNITGTSTGIGMEDDVHFCTITGNTVLNCASDGIGMVRNITDCVVMGNAISACGRNGISSYLYTGEPNQRLTISNNMVKGSGRYGIYTEMASGNTIKVTNNSVSSSTTADFTLATGTLAYGNPGYSGVEDYLASALLDADGTLAANSDSKVASQKAVKTYVDGLKYFSLFINNAQIDLVANSTYYFGSTMSAMTGTNAIRRVYIDRPCTVKIVRVSFRVAGTLGSSGSSSVYIRVNDSTDTLVSDAVAFTAGWNTVVNSNMSLHLNSGDYFEFKLVTANLWTTPATSVQPTAIVYFLAD